MRTLSYILLLALAAPAWGQMQGGVRGGMNFHARVGNGGGIPAGNFKPAPAGLGVAAMAVAGVQFAWFDASEWDEPEADPNAQPGMGNAAGGGHGGFGLAGGFVRGPGYNLTLAGKFQEPVSKLNGTTVDKVVADSGEDLLGENPQGFWPYLHQTASNGKALPGKVFSGYLRLVMPSGKATTIKELSGKVYYTILGKSRMVNLGLTEFAAGATGTEYKAKIESIEENQVGLRLNRQTLTLTLSGSPDEVGEFKFYDAAGKALKVQPAGVSEGTEANSRTYMFMWYEGPVFPAKGRIEVEVYDEAKKLVAPWKLENVPLFGRPAKPGA